MSEVFRVGPAHIFAGNFLDSSGFTDVKYVGKTRGDVVVRPNVAIARGRADQLGNAAMTDAVWLGGYAPEISIPLVDEDPDKLAIFMPGATVATSGSKKAITFPSTPRKIANAVIPMLAIIPVRDTYTNFGSGADPWNDQDAFYFSGVIARDLGELIYGPIEDSDDALNPHTVQLVALHRRKWQNDSTAVPSGKEVFWRGSPDAAGITGMGFANEGLSGFNTLIAS